MRTPNRRAISRFVGMGLLVILGLGSLPALAQPSDDEIIKQLTNPGVIKVELSSKPAHKEWSGTEKQYFWVKGAVVTRKAAIAELPDATLEVGGTATYTIIGDKFTWYKFYVTYNTYHGISAPPPENIVKMVAADPAKFLGDYDYSRNIVSPVAEVAIEKEPNWEWHDAKSVSVNIGAVYDLRPTMANPTQIDHVKQVYRVRLYRDDAKGAFSRFISQKEGDPQTLSSKKLTADEVKALPSLGLMDAAKSAKDAAGAQPKINIPAFKSDIELFLYTHKMLREADEATLKAYLLATLVEQFFVPNQYPLLTQQGEQLVKEVIDMARHKKMTYAQQYGPDPILMHYQAGMVQYFNELEPIHPTTGRLAAKQSGGKMVDGQPTGQVWKLTAIEFYVSEKPEHIEWINSFSSPEKLYAHHAGKETLASLTASKQAPASGAASPKPAAPVKEVATAVAAQPPPAPEPEPEPAALEWKTQAWDKAKLSIDLPAAAPKQTEGTIDGKLPELVMECECNGGLIRVTAILYTTEYNRSQAAQVVEGMAKSFISANQARQRSGSDWPVGVYGRQYKLSKPGVDMSYRATFAGKTLYQIMISAPQGKLDAAVEKRLFDSFKPTN